jgi:hypothetical protein
VEAIEHYIAEGEQIIGIYGNLKNYFEVQSIGFIVWRPPILT